ncbi:MAG: hypothetical protein NVS4B4_02780 [Bradyrhizobium sp.]
MPVPQRERQQQQRPVFTVIGNNDERLKLLTLGDLTLPGHQEIGALKGRGKVLLALEAAPDRRNLAEIMKYIDAGDAARSRARRCFCRSAFDRGSHGHRKTRL